MKLKTKVLIIFALLIYLVANFSVCFGIETIPNISSDAAIIMEMSSGRVLFGKNERKRVKIASTTKILTAILAVENKDTSAKVIISKKAALTGGSTVGLKEGSEITLEALLYGLLLKSGNDCAIAIAEYIAGDIATFVNMMNEKAYAIGAKDTKCTNPHGLDTELNYSTAYDIAKITCYAKKNEIISKIMGTKTVTIQFGEGERYFANTNRLLFTYEYCDGGKTGFTNIANRCLVATAKKDDLQVVAVVLGAATTDIRFIEGKKLLEYAVDNYKMVGIKDYINWYIDIPVYKGNIAAYVKKLDTDITLPLKESEVEQIYVRQNIVPIINAPAGIGMLLGNVQLYIKDELIYEENIKLDKTIKKNNFLDYILIGIKGIFSIELEL